MYRHGLGNCFLITLDLEGRPAHCLIDCGTLGALTTQVSLADVVADIRRTTGDHLNLLAATHEHQDHVNGFRELRSEFKSIRVDQVWLAWTENPADPLAAQLAKHREDLTLKAGLAAHALSQPASEGAPPHPIGLAMSDLLSFGGSSEALGASQFARTVDEAMDFVRQGLGAPARFLEPESPAIEESWAPGFRFYVLGPPRELALLRDTHSNEASEFYPQLAGFAAGAAAAAGVPLPTEEGEKEMPFDSRFRIPPENRLASPIWKRYCDPEQRWRRVDQDWLLPAADLALQLDSMTNNTSLALAIERVGDGKVLLFPGDAQQGNWLSWHAPGRKWTLPGKAEAGTVVTAEDLLRRTVFYQVGHHASHNATARRQGLEMMACEDELVAFIPVDRQVALRKNPPNSWQMPARSLYRRLLEKCQGRVARSDLGWAADLTEANQTVEKDLSGLADPQTWARWREAQTKANVTATDLFLDYTLT
jgi:hypothetical protein